MMRSLLLYKIEVTDRHPHLMLAAVAVLALGADWLADAAILMLQVLG
jgi:hypothetical protein